MGKAEVQVSSFVIISSNRRVCDCHSRVFLSLSGDGEAWRGGAG